MHTVFMHFRDCGLAAWICLLIGIVGVLLGSVGVLLGALKQAKAAIIVGIMTLALSVLSLGGGIVGKSVGIAKTEEALTSTRIPPDIKEKIRAEGTLEAGRCVEVGAGSAVLPFLAGALGLGLGMAFRKPA